jgi:hypothetical protein
MSEEEEEGDSISSIDQFCFLSFFLWVFFYWLLCSTSLCLIECESGGNCRKPKIN